MFLRSVRNASGYRVRGSGGVGDATLLTLGSFTGPAGTFRQRTELTTSQLTILAKLDLPQPPRVWQLTSAAQSP